MTPGAQQRDPREEFLAALEQRGGGMEPRARTHAMNVGGFIRSLHEQGGLNRKAGGFGLEQLQQLARVYGGRDPRMMTQGGPALRTGEPTENMSIIDAIARARAGRKADAAVAPVAAAPPDAGPGRELFQPGSGGIEDILARIAQATRTNRY